MKIRVVLVPVAAVALAAAGVAAAAAVTHQGSAVSGTVNLHKTKLGKVLAGKTGKTLYLFMAGLLGTTKRKTGAKQVTYAGHPLYYFKLDKAAGQTNGEGLDFFGGKWYGVNAAGRAVKHAQAGGGGGTTTTPTTTTNPYGY